MLLLHYAADAGYCPGFKPWVLHTSAVEGLN